MSNVIVDQFGKDIMMIPADDDHFTVNVDVAVSDQFLGWIFGLGGEVKIIAPENVKEAMKKAVKKKFVE